MMISSPTRVAMQSQLSLRGFRLAELVIPSLPPNSNAFIDAPGEDALMKCVFNAWPSSADEQSLSMVLLPSKLISLCVSPAGGLTER